MNKHILKLIWNRRREFVWIFAEQILVFAILFYSLSEVYSRLDKYLDPGNLNTQNVCFAGIVPDRNQIGASRKAIDAWTKNREYLMDRIEKSKYVEAVHKGYYTVPGNRPSSNNKKDSLSYKGNKYRFYIKTSDENFQKVFHVKMLEGTWYKDEALADGTYPAILTKSLVEELGLASPLGARLNYKGRDFTVTGVMNDYKSFLFDEAMPSAILANSAQIFPDKLETAMLIKEGQMPDFANYFWQEAQKTFPGQNHQPFISDMGRSRQSEMFEVLILTLMVAVIPTLFLSIFAFMGTFSLMYRQSRKHFGEYGLRMALGSTRNNLQLMVLKQSIAVSIFAALAGCVIGLNLYIFVFPEISLSIAIASGLSALALMLLFSIASVWYPARKASMTQPAEALKDE
jgi:ABC-type antimicrobial peptide transport system permease subunit